MTVDVSSGAIDAAMAALDTRSDQLRDVALIITGSLDAGDTGEVDVDGALFDLSLRWRDHLNAAFNQSYDLGRHIRAIGTVYFDYDQSAAAGLDPINGGGSYNPGPGPRGGPR